MNKAAGVDADTADVDVEFGSDAAEASENASGDAAAAKAPANRIQEQVERG